MGSEMCIRDSRRCDLNRPHTNIGLSWSKSPQTRRYRCISERFMEGVARFGHIRVLDRDRFVMAGYSAADQWFGRTYLRSAIYGNALRHRFLQPSAGQLSGCLAWRAAV